MAAEITTTYFAEFHSADPAVVATRFVACLNHVCPVLHAQQLPDGRIMLQFNDEPRPIAQRATLQVFAQLFPSIVLDATYQYFIPLDQLRDAHVRRFERGYLRTAGELLQAQNRLLELRMQEDQTELARFRLDLEQKRHRATRSSTNAALEDIVLRPTEDFRMTRERRPDCASYSWGIAEEVATHASWIAKADACVHRVADAQGREVFVSDERKSEALACKEKIACDIYAYFDAVVAQTELSRQRVVNPSYPGFEGRDFIHVMSKKFEGFHPYREQQNYTNAHPNANGCLVLPLPDGRRLREQGLGRILAVAAFIDDPDVIGDGNNIGYQILHEGEMPYIQTVKIDPGAAFFRLQPGEERAFPTEAKHIRVAQSAVPNTIVFNELPAHTKYEFLMTLHKIVNTDERTLIRFFVRNGAGYFATHGDLSPRQLCEFLVARKNALQTEYGTELRRTAGDYQRLLADQARAQQAQEEAFAQRAHELDRAAEARANEQARLERSFQENRQRLQQQIQAQQQTEATLARAREQLQEVQARVPQEEAARRQAEEEAARLQADITRIQHEQAQATVAQRQLQQTCEAQRGTLHQLQQQHTAEIQARRAAEAEVQQLHEERAQLNILQAQQRAQYTQEAEGRRAAEAEVQRLVAERERAAAEHERHALEIQARRAADAENQRALEERVRQTEERLRQTEAHMALEHQRLAEQAQRAEREAQQLAEEARQAQERARVLESENRRIRPVAPTPTPAVVPDRPAMPPRPGTVPAIPKRAPSPTAEALYAEGQRWEQAKDYPKAEAAYDRSARKGCIKAFTNLGFLALTGAGNANVPQPQRAYDCLLQAARGGHVRAMVNLAKMLRKGDGILPDLDHALHWYQQIVAAPDAPESEKTSARRYVEELTAQLDARPAAAPASARR